MDSRVVEFRARADELILRLQKQVINPLLTMAYEVLPEGFAEQMYDAAHPVDEDGNPGINPDTYAGLPDKIDQMIAEFKEIEAELKAANEGAGVKYRYERVNLLEKKPSSPKKPALPPVKSPREAARSAVPPPAKRPAVPVPGPVKTAMPKSVRFVPTDAIERLSKDGEITLTNNDQTVTIINVTLYDDPAISATYGQEPVDLENPNINVEDNNLYKWLVVEGDDVTGVVESGKAEALEWSQVPDKIAEYLEQGYKL